MAKRSPRADTQAALLKPDNSKTAEELAQEAADAAAAALAKEQSQQREPNADEKALAADDAMYAKALAEKNGYTLVPLKKIKGNHTVERVGTKVYPGDMVIAERL